MREETIYDVLTTMSFYCISRRHSCNSCILTKVCCDKNLGKLSNYEIKHKARALADWENQND